MDTLSGVIRWKVESFSFPFHNSIHTTTMSIDIRDIGNVSSSMSNSSCLSQCTKIHRKSLLLIIFSSDHITFTTITSECLWFTFYLQYVDYDTIFSSKKKKFLQFSLFIDHTQKSKIALNKSNFSSTVSTNTNQKRASEKIISCQFVKSLKDQLGSFSSTNQIVSNCNGGPLKICSFSILYEFILLLLIVYSRSLPATDGRCYWTSLRYKIARTAFPLFSFATSTSMTFLLLAFQLSRGTGNLNYKRLAEDTKLFFSFFCNRFGRVLEKDCEWFERFRLQLVW